MKKICALLFSCVAVVACVNVASAQDASYADEAKAIESKLFINPVESVTDDADGIKAVEKLVADDADEDSGIKCYWGGYVYYYPTHYHYHYYGWYCPVYYCHFRVVYYTYPVYATTIYMSDEAGAEADTPVKGRRTAQGAVISDDLPANSPLVKIGLKKGDLITAVDGQPVNGIADLRKIRAGSKIRFIKGEKVTIDDQAVNMGKKQVNDGFKAENVFGEIPTDGVEGAGMTLTEFFNAQK